MYEGQRFVWQLQHGSRHVVHSGHLAVLHHLTNAVTSSRRGVNCGPGLNEVAAKAEGNQTGGRLHIQHTGSHLGRLMQKRVSLQSLYSNINTWEIINWKHLGPSFKIMLIRCISIQNTTERDQRADNNDRHKVMHCLA